MKDLTKLLSLPACIAAASLSHAALAQHLGDIGLAVTDGRIATMELAADGPAVPRRAFGAVLGAEGIPWQCTEPGFDGEAETFAPGSRVGFRFTGPLLAWHGTAFAPLAVSDERMRLSFLTLSTTTGSGAVEGFSLAAAADGSWHRHLAMELLAASGSTVPRTGVYAATVSLWSTDPAVAASEPFWLVFDAGSEGTDFADAFAAAEQATSPACVGDLDGDGQVSGADLGVLLGDWGAGGASDLDGNGTVSGSDLGILLGAWGTCP